MGAITDELLVEGISRAEAGALIERLTAKLGVPEHGAVYVDQHGRVYIADANVYPGREPRLWRVDRDGTAAHAEADYWRNHEKAELTQVRRGYAGGHLLVIEGVS